MHRGTLKIRLAAVMTAALVLLSSSHVYAATNDNTSQKETLRVVQSEENSTAEPDTLTTVTIEEKKDVRRVAKEAEAEKTKLKTSSKKTSDTASKKDESKKKSEEESTEEKENEEVQENSTLIISEQFYEPIVINDWEYGATFGKVSGETLYGTGLGWRGNEITSLETSMEGMYGEWSMQQDIVDACKLTYATAPHYCALWVENVYRNAGVCDISGNACDLWWNYCNYNSIYDLEVGMLVAVQHASWEGDGWTYGHVGIYIGGGYVIHSTTVNGYGQKVITSLDDWIATYDICGTVMWGYPF